MPIICGSCQVSQKVNFVERRDGFGFAFASSWVQLEPVWKGSYRPVEGCSVRSVRRRALG
jgi:hypothetical protein